MPGLSAGDDLDDVGQQVGLGLLGAGAVPHQLEAFFAFEPGQHGFELGDRIPGAQSPVR